MDTVGIDHIAEALGVTPQAIANARRRDPKDFPPEVDRVAGSPRFARAAADTWVERRRRPRDRKARLHSAPRLANPALGLCYLALLHCERQHGVAVDAVGSDPLSRDALRERASRAEQAETALQGWLHDILGGPLTDADLADIAALQAAAPDEDLDRFGESLVHGRGALRHTDTTPETLAALIIAAAGPAQRGILDPAAGLGGLLLAVPGSPETLRVGFEVEFRNAAAARSRAYLADMRVRIEHLDALATPRAWAEAMREIDVLVCDAPHFRRTPGDDTPVPARGHEVALREIEFALTAAWELPEDARGVIAVSGHALGIPGTADARRALVATRRLHRVVAIPAAALRGYRFDLALLILGPALPPDAVVTFVDLPSTGTTSQRARVSALNNGANAASATILDLLGSPDVDLSPVPRVLSATRGHVMSASEIEASLQSVRDHIKALAEDGRMPVTGDAVEALLADLDGQRLGALRRQDLLRIIPGMRVRGVVRPRPLEDGPVLDGERAVITLASLRENGRLEPSAALPVDDIDRAAETEPGDVLFSRSGDSHARVDTDGGHLVVSPVTILRPSTDRLDPWLVAATLNSAVARRQMAGTGAGRIETDGLILPTLPESAEPAGLRALASLTNLRDALDELSDLVGQLVDDLGEAIVRSTTPGPSGPRHQ